MKTLVVLFATLAISSCKPQYPEALPEVSQELITPSLPYPAVELEPVAAPAPPPPPPPPPPPAVVEQVNVEVPSVEYPAPVFSPTPVNFNEPPQASIVFPYEPPVVVQAPPPPPPVLPAPPPVPATTYGLPSF